LDVLVLVGHNTIVGTGPAASLQGRVAYWLP
jgi:hypothetical protein